MPDLAPEDGALPVVSIGAGASRSIRRIDLHGDGHETIVTGFHRITEPAWSPDGSVLAFAGRLGSDEAYRVYLKALKAPR